MSLVSLYGYRVTEKIAYRTQRHSLFNLIFDQLFYILKESRSNIPCVRSLKIRENSVRPHITVSPSLLPMHSVVSTTPPSSPLNPAGRTDAKLQWEEGGYGCPPPPFGGGGRVWQVPRLTHPTFFTSQRQPTAIRRCALRDVPIHLNMKYKYVSMYVMDHWTKIKKQGKSAWSFLYISRASCFTTKACVLKKFAPLSRCWRGYRARLLFQPVLTDYSTPYCLEAVGSLLFSAPLVALVLQVTLFIRLLSQCTALYHLHLQYSTGCIQDGARSSLSPFSGNICLSFFAFMSFSKHAFLLPSHVSSSPSESCIILSFYVMYFTLFLCHLFSSPSKSCTVCILLSSKPCILLSFFKSCILLPSSLHSNHAFFCLSQLCVPSPSKSWIPLHLSYEFLL